MPDGVFEWVVLRAGFPGAPWINVPLVYFPIRYFVDRSWEAFRVRVFSVFRFVFGC